MHKHTSIELRAIDALFQPVHASFDAILAMAVSKPAALFYGLAIIAFATFDNLGLRPEFTWGECLLIWGVAVVVQVTAYVGLAGCWAQLQSRLGLFEIYLPVIGTGAFVINYFVTTHNIQYLSDGQFLMIGPMPGFGAGLILCLVFETLFFAFVLPSELRPQQNKPTQREITVAGERVPVGDIRYIQSSEHFIHIALPHENLRLRARLGDVVSQLDEADGILAHRSYWISRRAFADVVRENGCDHILTTDGERFSVARPRQKAVRAWIDTYIA